jgi:hypothetical protein
MMTKDNDKTVETDREITFEELDAISGGLNPQPLPPRWIGAGISVLDPIYRVSPQPIPV